MNYIDCHNHLLPGVDDGSKSMEESLDSLRILRTQGVAAAILTPHVNSPFASRPGVTKEDILSGFSMLSAVCKADPQEYPALLLGCEYYIDPAWETGMDPIPMAGSDVIMLELPYDVRLDGVRKAAQIARSQGYRILLAHPEKYVAFKYQWEDALHFLRESPDVMVQLESWDVGKHNEYSWRFIESRTATVIGTDSHGYHRPPSFDRAVNSLTEWAKGNTDRQEYIDFLLSGNAQFICKKSENNEEKRRLVDITAYPKVYNKNRGM